MEETSCRAATNRNTPTSRSARPSTSRKATRSAASPKKEAERRAWATVNKEEGGGNKSGSGAASAGHQVSSRKGGRLGGRAAARRPARGTLPLGQEGGRDAQAKAREPRRHDAGRCGTAAIPQRLRNYLQIMRNGIGAPPEPCWGAQAVAAAVGSSVGRPLVAAAVPVERERSSRQLSRAR